jgi:hypothetical protein
MKKLLFLLVLFVMPFIFATCGDDNKEPSLKGIEFEEDEVTIGIGEEYQLALFPIPDEATLPKCTYSSDNSDIVSVSKSKGKITGIKAGKTIIYAESADGKYEAECEVTVKSGGSSSSSLYREPYLKFGVGVSDIKNYETRNLYEETSTLLTYVGENDDVNVVRYLLDSNKKTIADIVICEKTTSMSTRVLAFLKERYEYMGKDADNDDVLLSSDGKMLIFISTNDTGNIFVVYQPYTSSGSPALRSSGDNFNGFVKLSKGELNVK